MEKIDSFLTEVRQFMPVSRVLIAPEECLHYAQDWSKVLTPNASAILFPESTEEVSRVLKSATHFGIEVVPSGGRTGLSGGAVATRGEVVLSTSRMNQIGALHEGSLTLKVGAGAITEAVHQHCAPLGLTWPVDFASKGSSTIGGNIATNAGGVRVIRYGNTRNWVLGLTTVTMDGTIYQFNLDLEKNNTGYDFRQLLTGSEGTLGIITEITLKLAGIPEAISAGICPFPSVKDACDATILTIQSGIPVARIELADELQVKAFNMHSNLGLQEIPMLFVEFHGTEQSVEEQAKRFGEIAADLGGGPFEWATKAEERSRLWQARHDAYWSALTLRPGCKVIATDVCVPISRLAECVVATQEDIKATGLVAPIVGHVGDGNFHLTLLCDMDDAAEIEKCRAFLHRLVERSLAMEGTCTGEHGVGQEKMKYLLDEHPAATLDAMRAIKRALDPLNIMNPGKIVKV